LFVVDPRESGFLDSLCANFLLTDTDNESMSGKDVRTRKYQVSICFFFFLDRSDFETRLLAEGRCPL
jgi:hypothetical protein